LESVLTITTDCKNKNISHNNNNHPPEDGIGKKKTLEMLSI
jgi:hypothetical protein